MTASAIGASSRYIPEGVTKFYWVTTMSNYLSPTRAELDAGTDLSPEVAETGDWSITSDAIDVPDLVATFTAQIPGKVSVDGATITMYATPTGSDARTLMARNTTGYIVKFGGGDVAGRKMDVFPVKVGSAGKPVSIGDPAHIVFTYYVTKVPAEDVSVPA